MAISKNVRPKATPRRSVLFVPGARLEIFPKAIASSTDIVCVDLEDAVAEKQKGNAREQVISLIENQKLLTTPPNKEIWIRINAIRSTNGLEDILAIAQADIAPDGIMIPKITAPEEIHILRDILSAKHKELKFHPLIETTQGLKQAYDIAKSSHKIGSIVFGGFDMSTNLRVEPNWDALLFARHELVLAAANAKVDLLDMPYFGLEDPLGLETEAKKAAEIGYTGKCAIHPKQIDIINQVFSPNPEEVKKAKDLIKKYESQDRAFVEIDGVLMEKPVVERLYRIIAIADQIDNRN
jgi:(S)-citramalyl-CoA lyase